MIARWLPSIEPWTSMILVICNAISVHLLLDQASHEIFWCFITPLAIKHFIAAKAKKDGGGSSSWKYVYFVVRIRMWLTFHLGSIRSGVSLRFRLTHMCVTFLMRWWWWWWWWCDFQLHTIGGLFSLFSIWSVFSFPSVSPNFTACSTCNNVTASMSFLLTWG